MRNASDPPSLAMISLPLRNGVMRRLELYPFRSRDPLTGKWIRARHKLQVPDCSAAMPSGRLLARRRFGTSRGIAWGRSIVPAASAGAHLHRADAALYALTQRKPGIVELSELAGVGIAHGEKHCNDQKYGN